MAATSQNYELWQTNDFLGVYRDIKSDPMYWTQWFQNEILSEDEFIDFEKMPIKSRAVAPFVLPLGRGKAIYTDTATGYRFKPAYSVTEDQIDPLMPLTRRVGIDPNASQNLPKLSPPQRLNLIRAAMTAQHVDAHARLLNYMAAIALRDGKITLSGKDYPTTLIDFQRAANHTITLTGGNRFGDVDVSIIDFFQLVIDRMTQADFGGMPTRATMGGGVWAVMRKDAEFLKHMDLNFRGNNITIERGVVSGETVYKVGEVGVGGGSGQTIELWVDNSTYLDPVTGSATRYIANNQILFTGTAQAVNGFQAFGRIIDRDANWEPMRLFPKNYLTGDRVKTEMIAHSSAPLMAPLNPNATLLGNVIA